MDALNSFFETAQNQSVKTRIQALKSLKSTLKTHEGRLLDALAIDLGKSPEEAWLSEVAIVYEELNHHIRMLKKWSKPQKRPSGLLLFPSKSTLRSEPYGVVLIIAPWNYPVQLLLDPLIGAVSAGNCVVAKPSSQTPNVAHVLNEILTTAFQPSHVTCIQYTREEMNAVLDLPFDYIFFTGGYAAGKHILKKASQHLTPVTLELGGKSPCIVHKSCNIDTAVKRILFGKAINCGQTCIAPDYLLVHRDCKEALIDGLKKRIKILYGSDARQSPFWGKIISEKTTLDLAERLKESGGNILYGGRYDASERFMELTLIEHPDLNSRIMKEEIFGPILPILYYDQLEEVLDFVHQRPKPLALYFFGSKSDAETILKNTSSGGACVNDCLMHVVNKDLPFGGVGPSGMGKYHGYTSFQTFSHQKAVVHSSTKWDLPTKYPPYPGISWLKRLLS